MIHVTIGTVERERERERERESYTLVNKSVVILSGEKYNNRKNKLKDSLKKCA